MILILWIIFIQINAVDRGDFDNPDSKVIVKPRLLDFGAQTIGYYTQQSILIHNLASNDIFVTTDFDEKDCFQPALIRNRHITLLRGEKYELIVNFLPQRTGQVDSYFSLYLLSVNGSNPRQVMQIKETGFGQENHFFLTPFVDINWPTHVLYNPRIEIYNPYNRVLRIKEMYSSGGGLQLMPPIDVSEVNSWHVPPFEYKTIMRVNLLSDHAHQHFSFVTIRLDDEQSSMVKLPVNVNFRNTPGVYSFPGRVHFGRFTRETPPKIASIFLISTFNSSKKIFSITIKDSILHQNGISVKLLKDVLHRNKLQKVAEVTINPALLPEFADTVDSHLHVGNITVRFGNSRISDLDIPFSAYVFPGTLKLSGFGEGFYSGNILPRLYKKNMTLENTYDVPVAIKSMDLREFYDEFLIENLRVPYVLKPKEVFQFAKFSLKRQGQRFVKNLELIIATNLTDFRYSVPIYNGDVEVHVNGKPNRVLNFELLGYNQTRFKIVRLRNRNPVSIQLLYHFTNVPFCEGYYARLSRADTGQVDVLNRSDAIQSQLVVLGKDDYVDLNVTITTPDVPHNVSGFFVVETNIDFVQLPLTFRTLEGKLVTTDVVYDNIFPGQDNTFSLRLTNTFNESVPLHSVTFDDDHVVSITNSSEKMVLPPLSTADVGRIRYTPRDSPELGYLLALDAKKQAEFFKGSHLNFDQVDYELKLYKHLRAKWTHLVAKRKHRLEVRGFISSSYEERAPITVSLNMVWPSFVKHFSNFPATHLGDMARAVIHLRNPSHHPVHMEVFFVGSHPHPHALVDILGLRNESLDLRSAFNVHGTTTNWLEKLITGSDVSEKMRSIVLGPGEEDTVSVGFSPKAVGSKKNALILRNNLTLFESVILQCTAARSLLLFEKRHVLTLSIHENLLAECKHADEYSIERGFFDVNKTFTLKNAGDIASHIIDITINGHSCEEYGIKVYDCGGFTLQPGESRPIKINFIPNFHFITMQYMLTVVPLAGEVFSIPVVTKVPSHIVNLCSDKMARHIFEIPVRVIVSTGLIACIISVFVSTYFFFSTPFLTTVPPMILQSEAVTKPVVVIPPKEDVRTPTPTPTKTSPVPTTSPQASPPPPKTHKPPQLEKAKKNKPPAQNSGAVQEKPSTSTTLSIPTTPSLPPTTTTSTDASSSPKLTKRKSKESKINKVEKVTEDKKPILQITKSPYHDDMQAAKPKVIKPARMTSIVKPQPKEFVTKSPPVAKDINIVKPEPKRSPPSQQVPSSSNNFPTEPPLLPAALDNEIEERFKEAVQEQRKNHFMGLIENLPKPWVPLQSQVPFSQHLTQPQTSTLSQPRNRPLSQPPTSMNGSLMTEHLPEPCYHRAPAPVHPTSSTLLNQVTTRLPYNTAASPSSVDAWFNPDLQQTFNFDSMLHTSTARQQSRFQSLFEASSSNRGDGQRINSEEIWSPLSQDRQETTQIWKSD